MGDDFRRSPLLELSCLAAANLAGNSYRKLLTTFATTSAEDFTAASRFHALEESVNARSFLSARLKCPFHIGMAYAHKTAANQAISAANRGTSS